MKRDHHTTIVLTMALSGALTLRAAITVVNPAGADHTPQSTCPALDGNNQLKPDPATYLPPPPAGLGVLAELAAGDSPFPGWTFNAGAALNGTLTIAYYRSVFDGAHYSGADIIAIYTPRGG